MEGGAGLGAEGSLVLPFGVGVGREDTMGGMVRMGKWLLVATEAEERGHRYPPFPEFPFLPGELAGPLEQMEGEMEEGEEEFSSTELPPDHPEGMAMEGAVATERPKLAEEISVVVGRVWMGLSSSTRDNVILHIMYK